MLALCCGAPMFGGEIKHTLVCRYNGRSTFGEAKVPSFKAPIYSWETPAPLEALIEHDRDVKIQEALDSLDPREREVLRRRFWQGMTSAQAGENMPRVVITGHTVKKTLTKGTISSARVNQMEAKALRKLRHPIRAKILSQFVDLAPIWPPSPPLPVWPPSPPLPEPTRLSVKSYCAACGCPFPGWPFGESIPVHVTWSKERAGWARCEENRAQTARPINSLWAD